METDKDFDIVDEKELSFIEENGLVEEDINSLEKDETFIGDSTMMYLSEMSKYPLLSPMEENFYSILASNPKKNRLLTFVSMDGYKSYKLNVPLLFRSLINNKSYNKIISDILNAYSHLSNNILDSDILIKYQKKANELNRALNKDELKKMFNIDNGEIIEKTLLEKEVKKYIDYRIGFDKLLVSNLRLVVSRANKYKSVCTLELNVLINEGNLGLIKAINKYDVSKGYRFSTYAFYWINQTIRRAIVSSDSDIRLPEGMFNDVIKFDKRIRELTQERKKVLTEDEILDFVFKESKEKLEKEKKRKLSIKEEKLLLIEKKDLVKRYLEYLQKPLRLDQAVSNQEEDSGPLGDFIPSKVDVEDEVMLNALKEEIEKAFVTLTDTEKKVIKMRFGVCEYNGMTSSRSDVAKIFHVKEERIRQIEMRALRKIKKHIIENESAKSLKIYY